jgi:alpha-beta hydrolase superfamily lysophospholipase
MRRLLPLLVLALGLAAAGCSGPPRYPARPASAGVTERAGVEHGTGFFRAAGGREQLFEQWWRPPRGTIARASKSVVVVVHGLKDHSSRYAALAERLVERGHVVYAFDLRGHAHSSGPRVGIDAFDEYLDDLSIFMRRVAEREGPAQTFLFGHSMGAAIATLWTMKKQPDLAGLVLSAGALKVNVSFVTVGATKLTAALFPQAGVFNLDLDDFSRDPLVVKATREDPLVHQDAAPARMAKELLGAIRQIEDNARALRVPLLALHGEADEVTDPEGSRALVQYAASADKTLKTYPRLVHDLLHEPERAVVMADIERWLDAHVK